MVLLTASILIFTLTYGLTTLLSKSLVSKNDELEEYTLKKDPYIYIFFLLFTGSLGISFFAQHFENFVVPLKTSQLFLPFLFSGLIYILFLLETNKLLNVSVFAFSILSAFLFLNQESLPLTNIIPYEIQILIIGLLLGGFVFSAKLFVALPGFSSSLISMILIGIVLISLAGGLPLSLILFSMLMLGVFLSLFQTNFFEFKLKTNEGALMSVSFLLGSLFLIGVNEFAAPSMLILMTYPLAELAWCLVFHYILKHPATDLYFNTAYFSAYEKGIDLTSLRGFLFKIYVVNNALALFQLYAPNPFTLPFLAFLINFWLLGKLYNADKLEKTLQETNAQFIQNVKDEIKTMKKNFKKN